ncbi:HAMP domain-containing histidine kinase [bacterium]|nr:HAMP domain-containing histidine kinase [bacterium]
MDDTENENLIAAQADFISTVSHELRTPLTSIRGFADTLLTSGDRLTDEQKKKFLTIIKEQSNRLIKLTENLLAVSKNNIEKLILKKVNIIPYVENTVKLVSNEKNQFKINIQNNLSDILADTDKFQQIMLNLLENASKYSNDNTLIEINIFQSDTEVIINITDEGIEIPEKDRERIFQKFTRLSSPLTQKTEGSGLGLYLTKTLVERMNGKISAKSEDGLTTFEVKFPIAEYDDVRVKIH